MRFSKFYIILSTFLSLGMVYAKADTLSAFSTSIVGGLNLTEQKGFQYDAALPGQPKTPAQIAVDQIKAVGAQHVILNPVATMTNPRGNDLFPKVPSSERAEERARYKRLIDYIHTQGLTVGIRPIFFVVKEDGSFPYLEKQPDGSNKLWWHGNIQPTDPNQWFESFRSYLDIYLLISKMNKVEEFTLGAELYSMTVGIEDQWFENPYGFPGRWLELLRYSKKKLNGSTRVMYDINFTDDQSNATGVAASGGELERWRYRLVDLAHPTDPAQLVIWKDLVSFWNELDAIGVDMYRSLAGPQDFIPSSQSEVVRLLRRRSDEFANQMDTAMASIEGVTEKHKMLMFKEVGFRSVKKGYVDPFNYQTGVGIYDPIAQAASFQAIFESFWIPRFDWFAGGSFWDVGVDPARNSGAGETGFSPIGKGETSAVLQKIFSFSR